MSEKIQVIENAIEAYKIDRWHTVFGDIDSHDLAQQIADVVDE